MAEKKENFFAYPCEQSGDCLEFLEGWQKMSFTNFCETYCKNCKDCVLLDIPYSESEEY